MAKNTQMTQERHKAGSTRGAMKTGGQFAQSVKSNPEAVLQAADKSAVHEQLRARRVILRNAGYMPAASGIADGSPKTTAGIDRWWDTHFNRAEFAPDKAGGTYHLMPDDYTPGMTQGNALSAHRRTHRMKYEGAGVTVRMPSATAIKRYSKEINGQTFDVPVEAEYPGGTVSGYVRVTMNGPGEWSVSGLNMKPDASAYVSEAIKATLEDRRPSKALGKVEDLLERRRARFAGLGVKLDKVEQPASWVQAMGYNEHDNQMVVQLGNRVYGYHVPKQTYEAAKTSWSPGQIYNKLIKGSTRRYEIALHEKCGRYYQAGGQHQCPSAHKARDTSVKLYNEMVKERVIKGYEVPTYDNPVIAQMPASKAGRAPAKAKAGKPVIAEMPALVGV